MTLTYANRHTFVINLPPQAKEMEDIELFDHTQRRDPTYALAFYRESNKVVTVLVYADAEDPYQYPAATVTIFTQNCYDELSDYSE